MTEDSTKSSRHKCNPARTPGPFYVPPFSMAVRMGPPSLSCGHVCMVPYGANSDEVDELLDLLNKGTHFDDMLAAAKGVIENGPTTTPFRIGTARNALRAAIAKAEPTK